MCYSCSYSCDVLLLLLLLLLLPPLQLWLLLLLLQPTLQLILSLLWLSTVCQSDTYMLLVLLMQLLFMLDCSASSFSDAACVLAISSLGLSACYYDWQWGSQYNDLPCCGNCSKQSRANTMAGHSGGSSAIHTDYCCEQQWLLSLYWSICVRRLSRRLVRCMVSYMVRLYGQQYGQLYYQLYGQQFSLEYGIC